MALSEWERFIQEQNRIQSAKDQQARLEDQNRRKRLQEEEKQRAFYQARSEQLQRDAEHFGKESVKYLQSHMQSRYQVAHIAESIRQDWQRQGAKVTLTPVGEADLHLNQDGTLKRNRSYAGFRLSYKYNDVREVEVDNGDSDSYSYDKRVTEVTNSLLFGVGYFGDDKNEFVMPPSDSSWWRQTDDAVRLASHVVETFRFHSFSGLQGRYPRLQFPFSDSDVEKGILSYWTVNPRPISTAQIAIPVSYTDSQQTFFQEIYRWEQVSSPKVLVPARQRIAQFRRG